MKITKLTIKNIGKIAYEVIELNKPLILFYGEIRQGKTTILNAVRWVCGGSYPSDIIRHGEKEAHIELGFDGGCIRKEWYVSKKTSETKDRGVTFIKAGRPVPNTAAEIKRLMNPFLLNQDYLRQMSELERKKYFTEMFSVDTAELDTEAFNAGQSASALRSKLSGYGDIDLTKVLPVDSSALKKELEAIRAVHAAVVKTIESQNKAVREHNGTVARGVDKRSMLATQISGLETQLVALKGEKTKVDVWLENNPNQKEAVIPFAPDTSDLEAKIQNAAGQNARADQYAKNKARAEAKEKDEAALSALEKRQREIKTEKIAKLATISETCGIAELAFDETGQFTYQGTQAGMLSTSQIMRLSSELSALYPEGLGVELLDRGESLGKSIFEFIDRAKADELTILATIVGERPATVPADCGVFVVADGKIQQEAAELSAQTE